MFDILIGWLGAALWGDNADEGPRSCNLPAWARSVESSESHRLMFVQMTINFLGKT
jgi:hypothetical protein